MRTAFQIAVGALTIGVLALEAPSAAYAQVLLNTAPGQMSVNVVSYRDTPFRTVVRQQYDFSCGSAALATLLRFHYDRDVDEKTVFKAMYDTGNQEEITRVGFSLLDMKRFLDAHGFASDGFRLTLKELEDSHSPAIVMIDTNGYKHFVVLKGVDETRVLIGDPALGLKIYSHEQFSAMWNGVAFMIRDPSDRYNQDGEWKPWAPAPMATALPDNSLSAMTLQLPPLYQISTSFSLDSYLR